MTDTKPKKAKLRRTKMENIFITMASYTPDPNDEHALLIETTEGLVYRFKAELVGRDTLVALDGIKDSRH